MNVASQQFQVRASWALPIVLLVFFGGLGIFLLTISLVKEENIAPGLFFLLLGAIFLIGQRVLKIELTKDKLIYRELGRKREIPIDEIDEIFFLQGPNQDVSPPIPHSMKFRIEVRHVSDPGKNIYIPGSFGMFHHGEIQKLLDSLDDRGITIKIL